VLLRCSQLISTVIAIGSLILASLPAHAATRVCRVKLSNVTPDLNGTVYFSGLTGANGAVGTIGWQWQAVCSVSTIKSGVQTEACKSWLSTALTAQAQGKTLFMFYDDVQNNGQDCSLFPGWNNPIIQYVGIEN
jgi:hypothetical protein